MHMCKNGSQLGDNGWLTMVIHNDSISGKDWCFGSNADLLWSANTSLFAKQAFFRFTYSVWMADWSTCLYLLCHIAWDNDDVAETLFLALGVSVNCHRQAGAILHSSCRGNMKTLTHRIRWPFGLYVCPQSVNFGRSTWKNFASYCPWLASMCACTVVLDCTDSIQHRSVQFWVQEPTKKQWLKYASTVSRNVLLSAGCSVLTPARQCCTVVIEPKAETSAVHASVFQVHYSTTCLAYNTTCPACNTTCPACNTNNCCKTCTKLSDIVPTVVTCETRKLLCKLYQWLNVKQPISTLWFITSCCRTRLHNTQLMRVNRFTGKHSKINISPKHISFTIIYGLKKLTFLSATMVDLMLHWWTNGYNYFTIEISNLLHCNLFHYTASVLQSLSPVTYVFLHWVFSFDYCCNMWEINRASHGSETLVRLCCILCISFWCCPPHLTCFETPHQCSNVYFHVKRQLVQQVLFTWCHQCRETPHGDLICIHTGRSLWCHILKLLISVQTCTSREERTCTT